MKYQTFFLSVCVVKRTIIFCSKQSGDCVCLCDPLNSVLPGIFQLLYNLVCIISNVNKYNYKILIILRLYTYILISPNLINYSFGTIS